MSALEIYKSMPLEGELFIQGSKNAVLPMMAAAVLNRGVTVIENVPKILDVYYMIQILQSIGCKVDFENRVLVVDATVITSSQISAELVGKMRCSIIMLGALIGRLKESTTYYPGGCSIGKRPIDFHLTALKKIGVVIEEEEDKIVASAVCLRGSEIELPFPSVGATENILLASVLADGTTIIKNCAKEPEIITLCEFLTSMGAKIFGIGSDEITVIGVEKLHDTRYVVDGDRIVAMTYLIASAVCGGTVSVRGVSPDYVKIPINILKNAGCLVTEYDREITLSSNKKLKSMGCVRTGPYPEFPTDLQSLYLVAMSISSGVSLIEENIFENRFATVDSLKRMGANIVLDNNRATVFGVDTLQGADLVAKDLRDGAALVIAGLIAEGKTVVRGCYHIERGYDDFALNLLNLGACIKCIHDVK